MSNPSSQPLPPISQVTQRVEQANPGYVSWRANINSHPGHSAPAMSASGGPPPQQLGPRFHDVASLVSRFQDQFQPTSCTCVRRHPIHSPNRDQMPGAIYFIRPDDGQGVNIADVLRLGDESMQDAGAQIMYDGFIPAMEIPYILVVDDIPQLLPPGMRHVPAIQHCEHQPLTRFHIAYSVALACMSSVRGADLGHVRLVSFKAPSREMRARWGVHWVAKIETRARVWMDEAAWR
ncbi:hypothetical protein FB45DRAFT_878510 [Roridomyces roridus]|uniref:Uncharacterized protein n=1 Tax=Roridomyces roridus TaxID=1738132 RepID=A0AAD7B048_9AGAR|nr:hypothetical protein FB45DRAFT_878510 [Roridomyces roridus]